MTRWNVSPTMRIYVICSIRSNSWIGRMEQVAILPFYKLQHHFILRHSPSQHSLLQNPVFHWLTLHNLRMDYKTLLEQQTYIRMANVKTSTNVAKQVPTTLWINLPYLESSVIPKIVVIQLATADKIPVSPLQNNLMCRFINHSFFYVAFQIIGKYLFFINCLLSIT